MLGLTRPTTPSLASSVLRFDYLKQETKCPSTELWPGSAKRKRLGGEVGAEIKGRSGRRQLAAQSG